MKKRNLSAKKKIHNKLIYKLKNTRINKIFLEFSRFLNKYNSKKICIAVSGGPDSLALAFLAKIYSIKKKIDVFYFIVDHKLRLESTKEAKLTKSKLIKFDINCKILTWKGKKPSSNIQAIARNKRYELIVKECLKRKINTILTAHQKDDFYENFFIRMIRGSGLKGLSSFSKVKTIIVRQKKINILRPLLDISKNDLCYLTNNTFNFFIKDPSNENKYFLRIKIRKLINELQAEGLNLNKFNLTLKNLGKSNASIDYYVNNNIKQNAKILSDKKSYILNETFFKKPDEIVFRSFSEIICKVSKKKNYTRGKKLSNLIKKIKYDKNFNKMTLSGCMIEKINKSVIILNES